MKPAVAPEAPRPAAPAASAARPAVRARPRRWHRVGRALWLAFLALDVPLLLAVAGGLSAAYLAPWWVQLLGVALPYLTWVLGVAAVVPLAARRWGWFAVHLVFLGAVAWRAYPPERLAGPPPPAEGDLVMMTFNVPLSGPSREALSDSLVALVARERPDVLALQEVVAFAGRRPLRHAAHVEAVVAALPYTLVGPPRPARGEPDPIRVSAVPVLVHDEAEAFAVVERQVIPLGSGAEGDEPSSATRTRFRWRGREGVLYNVHLRSFGDEKPWEDRIRLLEPTTWLPYLRRYRDAFRARAADVEQLRAAIEAEALPVLIAGDFNGTADNWVYRRLRGDRRDAFLVAGAGAGYTYRADRPVVRIDFVLVDEAWDVTAAEVPAVGFSDHRPLVVRLRWAEERKP
ncbi:MAG TPA: endonuclease/exonuclease/phosphatase family protein [Rubricoccaceae bacterium]|nr:endonuclease/exonuclease/phosphatase family protein [Rubricoccaceae bacterium]